MGLMDKKSLGYRVGTFPVEQSLPADIHTGVERKQDLPKVTVTTLDNGVRILTETPTIPGLMHLGILLNCGTRDESLDAHTTGINLALKHTALKSNTRTNEQINYCMVQMSGGEFKYDYDQENIYVETNCLAHDTYDMLQMMADTVLDDKTIMDEEAAHWRIDEHWKLKDFAGTMDERVSSLWHSIAYGHAGLGMPLSGFQSTFQHIGYYHMNEFRKRQIVPSGMIIAAAGVANHDEFVQAVRPYYQFLEPVQKPARQKSVYRGGEHRELCDADTTYFNLSFEGPAWTSEDMATSKVLKTLIGDGGGFSTGGPGKGMHSRAYTRILSRYYFINSIKSESVSFSDSGHFRILAVGPSASNEMLAFALLQELLDLVNVTDTEVTRAKNCLKNQVLQTLEKTGSRLEDTVKTYSVFGKTPQEVDFIGLINRVTTDSVKKFARKMLKSKPTVVALGGDTHKIPSADLIAEIVKQKLR